MKKLKNKNKATLYSLLTIIFLLLILSNHLFAFENKSYIAAQKERNSFILSESGHSNPIIISNNDYPGVIRVANILQRDMAEVTGSMPDTYIDQLPSSGYMIIAGTIGKNSFIDGLINNKGLEVDDIKDKRESFIIQTVDNPFPSIDKALIIVGSDKRGTIYGLLDLSKKIGVSPWHWWGDVPVKKKKSIYISPGRYTEGEPKVKFRGIFINDEAPCLSGWSKAKFGTDMFNSELYEPMFELILRLKGNFLWPAMWGRTFYDDDPENARLADEYGIVIGTSHHEPMMRAHDEWRRYGRGKWDYERNSEELKRFWRDGIKRMGRNESIITLAMRGDRDMAMSSDANIELLQKIVMDQREILTEVTGKNITEIPQVWALYKEVQEYYDKGMRVPDDVTLLLCDDNWGNIRKLPNLADKPRKGGYGIYYHFDFVGGPRNYRWLNTTQIERVWEQMRLAWEYGASEIWVVNVGDLKPMEFPISFFLDYAWDPERITAKELPQYYIRWAEEQFGKKYSNEIADILIKYTRYNSRRKPEMLSPETYSLVNYREAETVVNDYKELYEKAKKTGNALGKAYQDSYYQLILHPVEACSNLYELYFTVAKNRLYAEQKRNLTNDLAIKAEELFKRDTEISLYYNKVMAGGKWDHMMDQVHIGYTMWNDPPNNIMPEVVKIEIPDKAMMGIAVEGAEKAMLPQDKDAMLPEFDSLNNQKYYIDIFNTGKRPFKFIAVPDRPWIKISDKQGEITTEKRIWISIDWDRAPSGSSIASINISDQNNKFAITAVINKREVKKEEIKNCFVEANNYVSMEAVNYTYKSEQAPYSWQIIPNLGRTGSAITLLPVTAMDIPQDMRPMLEYDIYLFNRGTFNISLYLSPTQNFGYKDGLKFAVSIDDQAPVVINMHKGDTPDWKYPKYWEQAVGNNIRIASREVNNIVPGRHTLKFYAIDAGIVLQKIVIGKGDVKPAYLGPPESYRNVSQKK
jgi:hypothetical protein